MSHDVDLFDLAMYNVYGIGMFFHSRANELKYHEMSLFLKTCYIMHSYCKASVLAYISRFFNILMLIFNHFKEFLVVLLISFKSEIMKYCNDIYFQALYKMDTVKYNVSTSVSKSYGCYCMYNIFRLMFAETYTIYVASAALRM